MAFGDMHLTGRLILRSTLTLLVVGLLALMGIVGMTFWLGERTQHYFDEAIAARDARGAAVDLRNALVVSESSQRGFLLTGNEIYLAPYDTAKAQADRQLQTVGQFVSDDPQMAPRLARLVEIVTAKFAEMDATIALKRDRRDADVLATIRTNKGKALMDEANVFFAGLIGAADARLTEGVAEQRTNAAWLRWASIVGGIVIVVVVTGAGLTVLRYTRELRGARDEVEALNAGLEERVRARTADLAQANTEIQRFAHVVTHDLRSPLVNIMGFAGELEGNIGSFDALVTKAAPILGDDDPVVAEARLAAASYVPEAIGFIRSSAKKMDGLISAILKLSREGRRTLRPESVDLDEVVRSSAAVVQHALLGAGGSIEIAVDAPPLLTDRIAIEQVIGNILDNAVKYRARERPLRIAVKAWALSPERVAIEVSDNGRGIAPQDQERVFELFRRAGPVDQPGEGIGLAAVRTTLRLLGGNVSVRSELGVGTSFRITLPRRLDLPTSEAS